MPTEVLARAADTSRANVEAGRSATWDLGREKPPKSPAQIKREIDASDSDWDREKLQERLAKLAGGVVVIRVGGHTEVELKEKKHRIEDAVSATRAAIEEGIVSGGGTALVQAASVLEGDLGHLPVTRAGSPAGGAVSA